MICPIAGEVPSRLTSKCLDCQQFLCENCRIQHITMSAANNNLTVDSNTNATITTTVVDNQNINNGYQHNNSNLNGFNNTKHVDTETVRSNSNGNGCIAKNNDNDGDGKNVDNPLNHPHNIVSLEELCLSASVDSRTGGGQDEPLVRLNSVDGDNQNGSHFTGTENVGNSIVCPNHAGNELKYYCSHCETAVCETCTQVSWLLKMKRSHLIVVYSLENCYLKLYCCFYNDYVTLHLIFSNTFCQYNFWLLFHFLQAEHMGHMTLILSEAVNEHKTSLTSLVTRVRQMTPVVTKAIQNIEDTCSRLANNQNMAHDKVSLGKFINIVTIINDKYK